ncbi:TetR/AcrR family transcriptional regulator [Pseudonocardia sp. EV170527-09]|uniref:TetR/AcrR family transcriptional regulator n=1 Tax=Pseudonocardia sp. EV170527-09 TaxID=2603411 RepID=UPI0019615BE0|nr:TetR/AcrR family transcriptional regulator [Pseudonocardia sp. EV170527-09]
MTARRARRREPRQERSRTMVERIAAVAGVSPGSLYQYFPDKDAVLTEVLDRYLDAMEARVSRAFLDSVATAGPDAGTATAVRATLDALLDTFGEEPDLLRVIVEQLPRSPGGRRAAFAGRIDDLVTTVLLTRGAGDTDAARAAAWTVVRTVEHLTTGYVLERPGFARAVVVDELTALVAGYLDARLSGGRVASDGPS